MSYMYAGTIRNRWGRAVEDAELTVYTDSAGTTLADLEDSGGTPIANPTTTDERGRVEVYCASYRLWYKVTGDDTVMRLVRFCDLQQTDVDGLPFFDVTAYGAEGDGVTDDLSAVQAAYDAAVVSGGVILFPPGSYYLSDYVSVDPNTSETVVFSGYGATIVTSTNGFIDFPRDSAHDVFQHLVVEGFHIDGGSLSSVHPVIGNRQNTRANVCFDDIVIRDVRATGLPTDNESVCAMFLWLECTQDGNGEATQDYLTNITLENVSVDGGDCVAFIGSNPSVTTPLHNHCNIWMDGITLRNVHHDRGTDVGYHTNSFQIGGHSFGGTCRFEGCSSNTGDDCCFEVNGFQLAEFVGCTAFDPTNTGFFMPNFNDRNEPQSQVVVFRDCHCYVTVQGNKAWSFESETDTPAPGTVILDGCSYTLNKATFSSNYALWMPEAPGPRRIVLRDCSISAIGWTVNATSTTTRSLFRFFNDALTDGPTQFVIDGLDVHIDGTNSGTAKLETRLFEGFLAGLDFDWRNIRFQGDITCTGGGTSTYILFWIGKGTDAVSISGLLDRFCWLTSTGDSSPIVLYLYNAVTPGLIEVNGCDWSRMSSHADRLACSETADRYAIRERDCIYVTAPAPASISPSGSPYTYTNGDFYDEFVVVSGGTVSAIELSTNAGTTFTNVGATAGSWLLRSGDQLKVTYSSAPTMTKVPKP